MPEERGQGITRTDQPPEFTQLPPQFTLISIARGAPHRLREIPALRELAPGEWFKSVDVDEYRRRYLDQLARLDPGETVCRIEGSGTRPVGGAPLLGAAAIRQFLCHLSVTAATSAHGCTMRSVSRSTSSAGKAAATSIRSCRKRTDQAWCSPG